MRRNIEFLPMGTHQKDKNDSEKVGTVSRDLGCAKEEAFKEKFHINYYEK